MISIITNFAHCNLMKVAFKWILINKMIIRKKSWSYHIYKFSHSLILTYLNSHAYLLLLAFFNWKVLIWSRTASGIDTNPVLKFCVSNLLKSSHWHLHVHLFFGGQNRALVTDSSGTRVPGGFAWLPITRRTCKNKTIISINCLKNTDTVQLLHDETFAGESY